MIAVVVQLDGEGDVAQHQVLGTEAGEVDVVELDPAGGDRASTRDRQAPTPESVSRTCPMQFAQTAARGTITNMKVAIMTPMRICIM